MTALARSLRTHVLRILMSISPLVVAENTEAQVRSVEAWAGLTEDLKPNPFADTTERNSGTTLGATLLLGAPTGRVWGATASWSRFSDELHHVDLLVDFRWLASERLHLDLEGGLSVAHWSGTAFPGQADRTSIDGLIGPLVGVVVPLGERLAIGVAGVAQFRWSPDYNDYLRLGARLGLIVS
jgi:hypothetical protein